MQIAGLQTLNALVEELTANYVHKKDLAQYSMKKQETAEEGFASTYWFTINGQKSGDAINIPKDKFLKSADVKTATADDSPVEGCKAGEKYIDLLVATENSPQTGGASVPDVKRHGKTGAGRGRDCFI